MTVLMTIAILAVLPISRALSRDNKPRKIVEVGTAGLPPPEPPPPEPPPPPEEEREEEKPKLDTPPPMRSLSMLESMLNPGMGGVGVGGLDFSDVNVGSTVQEAIIFSLRDLDRRPRRLSGNPQDIINNLPVRFRQEAGFSFDVRIEVLVDPRGYMSVVAVRGDAVPEVVDVVRRVIGAWRYEPPMVDGEAVTVGYIIPFEYSN